MEKTTPLSQWHQLHQGQMVPFAGYLMPVQYQHGIIYEHQLVRQKAGLFDVSHMGELYFKGPDALLNLNHLVSNDFTNLEINKIRYGVLVDENGFAIDDLLVYRMNTDEFLVIVNASNTQKDEAFIRPRLVGELDFLDLSGDVGQVALQGPKSLTILEKLTTEIPKDYYSFIGNVKVEGMNLLISRTGYTGEDGFEIYCETKDTETLWELLLKTGEAEGLEPCGLGARDTLRLEAAMPLYGHELSESITPIEAGLKMFVKADRAEFIAKDALLKEPTRKRIGLQLVDRGIAREGAEVYCDDVKVGYVTSGSHSPTLNASIAMALVSTDVSQNLEFSIEVRGRRLKATKVKLPFYKR